MIAKKRQELRPFVLVIEDDETSLSIYSSMLKKVPSFQNVCTFLDAREALYFLEEHFKSHDCISCAILLDVHMPHMDGWQFLDILHRIPQFIKHPPIIWLCSSDSSRYAFQKSLEQSFVARFLIKPVLSKDLADFSQEICHSLNLSPRGMLNESEGIATHFPASSPLLDVYPMSEKKFEKIILTARSSVDLGNKIERLLQENERPAIQAETLLEVFRTLAYFAKKVWNSNDTKKDALLQLLNSYIEVLDIHWASLDTDKHTLVNSYFYLYLAEKDLYSYRYQVFS